MSEDENLSMNKELCEWLKDTKNEIKLSKKSQDFEKRKPSGLCEICGEKNSKFFCLKCGRSVCLSCHFKIIGICKKCVPKETAEKWEGKPPDWEKILGVEWVD
jgi:hypothetical protein